MGIGTCPQMALAVHCRGKGCTGTMLQHEEDASFGCLCYSTFSACIPEASDRWVSQRASYT